MRPELTAWFNKFMYFYDRGYKRSILLRKNHTQLKSCVVVDLDKSHASFRRKTWIQAGKVDMRSSSYGTWHLINYYLVDRRMKYTDIRICRNHMGIKIYWLYSSLYPHAHNLRAVLNRAKKGTNWVQSVHFWHFRQLPKNTKNYNDFFR